MISMQINDKVICQGPNTLGKVGTAFCSALMKILVKTLGGIQKFAYPGQPLDHKVKVIVNDKIVAETYVSADQAERLAQQWSGS